MHDDLDTTGDLPNPILRGTERINTLDYLTYAVGREASAFIEKHQRGPWLCYLAFHAVPTPLQASEKYHGRFKPLEDPKRPSSATLQSAMDDAVGTAHTTLRQPASKTTR